VPLQAIRMLNRRHRRRMLQFAADVRSAHGRPHKRDACGEHCASCFQPLQCNISACYQDLIVAESFHLPYASNRHRVRRQTIRPRIPKEPKKRPMGQPDRMRLQTPH
jgi:hypothetical protein